MKDIIFKGVGTALITPFLDNSINFDEFKRLIEFQISGGADSLIIGGTTGESSTMTTNEKKYLIRFACNTINKRVPVIAGTGTNCTKTSIDLSQYAESVGADALLVVTPYYNKTTQKGLIDHYSAIANSVEIPIILYNVPSRTGLNITPETCYELSKIKNIVAIKEASGSISQVAKIASLCKDDLYIYSGNDDQIIPILSLGGIGAISVVSNILPKEVHNMIHSFFNKKFHFSRDYQIKLIPLIDKLFSEVNPIPIKEALNIIGFDVGFPRLPLVRLSDENMNLLKEELKNYNIKVK